MMMMKNRKIPRHSLIMRWRGIIFFVVISLITANLSASVLVAPTSVYLSEKDRTGRMTLQNPTDHPEEVSVFFRFGVPISDSLGNVQIELSDTTGYSDPRSCVDWLKVFPRKLILAPGASQVIRFVARPPKDLPDGEYWARIVIRSEGSSTTLPVAGQNEQITTKLNMIMQTAIILKYRTGNLISKLDVIDTRVKNEDSTVNCYIDMANRGNVSYIGILKGRLIDANKKEIASDHINLAVYRDLTRVLSFKVPPNNFQPPFKIEITIDNDDRKDLPPEGIIRGNSFLYTVAAE
ncbi:MAG: hypothetical protein DRP35_03225 [Candidatus Zixiibacteriota bacterium]|nr:MAG: hypothetical protein DRP35_03225 [candidate division Zixibacteria bacterium]